MADEREYITLEGGDKQTWDIEPGFYNAYKLEVLSVNGGGNVIIQSFSLIGLSTELLNIQLYKYTDPPSCNYDLNIHGHNIPTSFQYITQPHNNVGIKMSANGYIDFVFYSHRKARSFCICNLSSNGKLTGWDILGSNDGENWDILFTARDMQLESDKDYYFNLKKVALYRQYRLKPVSTDAPHIAYFQLYRTGSPDEPSHPYKLRFPGKDYDPNELGELNQPGYPLGGEPTDFHVTPNITNQYDNNWLVKTNEWL